MLTFMICLTVLLYAVVVLCASVVPRRSRYSVFERGRRGRESEQAIALEDKRERTAEDISGVLRVVGTLALVMFILLTLTTFGWLFGSIAAVAGVLLYGQVARMRTVHDTAQRLYESYEGVLLDFVLRHHGVFRFFRGVPQAHAQDAVYIASREELLYTVDHLPKILTRDEQKLIRHGLEFSGVTVESVMTPRSVMDVVKKDELLGPLMLDELHKTGHSRFPVYDGDVDHIVGILYVRNLMQLHDKKTHKASELMTVPVHYIKEDQTLDHALAAFLRTHHHLFVVVNEYRETVGLLSLEDTIEALLGRKIVDEFDTHEDLRAVASRNPRGNNAPAKHTDV